MSWNGMLLKICVLIWLQILLSSIHRVDHYGDIEMDPGYPILPDTVLDPSGRYIYAISTNKVSMSSLGESSTSSLPRINS